ncbi:O-antigen ligase family protein [Bradyrhizobium erythrophlei]|uniref:O-antigen ligase family protein n=1 Tax=Bradyrhizobium erythrophlei TaxID=1437360 RepID=UPI0035EFD49E
MTLHDHRISIIAASVSFWAWCALLSYPMIGDSFAICQAIGLAFFLVTMTLTYSARFSSIVTSMTPAQLAILLIIYLSLFLQLHDDEPSTLSGILYTSLLPVTAVAVSALWTLEPVDFERCMTVASVLLCLFGVSAIVILGWPESRDVGGILQPNIFAAPLLAGFLFSLFSPGLIGVAVRILCFGMIALVSSRYALIGCLTALALFELTFNPLSPAKIPALIVALIAAIVFWPLIAHILAIDDSDRGLTSGISGRDERWHLAENMITNNPLGIGFKRADPEEAGHNGFLKIIVEFGIPGGALLILLLVYSLVIAAIDAGRRVGKSWQQHRFECARFGGLAALLFGAFFQPQVFSLGDTFAVSVLLLLFKPRMKPIVGTARTPVRGI